MVNFNIGSTLICAHNTVDTTVARIQYTRLNLSIQPCSSLYYSSDIYILTLNFRCHRTTIGKPVLKKTISVLILQIRYYFFLCKYSILTNLSSLFHHKKLHCQRYVIRFQDLYQTLALKKPLVTG